MALMIFTENLLCTKAVWGPFIIISPQLLIINVGSILNFLYCSLISCDSMVPVPQIWFLLLDIRVSVQGFQHIGGIFLILVSTQVEPKASVTEPQLTGN